MNSWIKEHIYKLTSFSLKFFKKLKKHFNYDETPYLYNFNTRNLDYLFVSLKNLDIEHEESLINILSYWNI